MIFLAFVVLVRGIAVIASPPTTLEECGPENGEEGCCVRVFLKNFGKPSFYGGADAGAGGNGKLGEYCFVLVGGAAKMVE